MSQFETPNNLERRESVTVFASSSKTKRSPIRQSAFVTRTEGTPVTVLQQINNVEKQPLAHSSTKQEFILKQRLSEEEAIADCKKVLRKMRAAMARQRNINMEVQNGVMELEELMDVITNYRENWKAAETERESGSQQSQQKEANSRVIATAKSTTQMATTHNKRNAESPVEANPEKKQKNAGGDKEITSKERKHAKNPGRINELKSNPDNGHKKIPKVRSEAVIIKPQEGHSYADVLRSIRQNVKPEETDVAVQSIRKTKTGAILLVMGRGGRKQEFRDAIQGTLKEAAIVKDLKPKTKIEIQDLDSLTTEEEVVTALSKELNVGTGDIVVRLTAINSREQRKAFVTLSERCAQMLLRIGRIKIAVTNCRIRHVEEEKRCFRCFGAGHMQWECKGPDRKGMGLCIKCGEKGHKLKQCKNQPKCCVCSQEGSSNVNHLPGSKSCKTNKGKAQ